MGHLAARENLEVYLGQKGIQVPAWAPIRGIDPNDISQMLTDIVPFEEQDTARKYMLFYLDTFFTVNAKGGGRFSEGLAVCHGCYIPVFPEDLEEIQAALHFCTGYEKKILYSILKRYRR